jgi:hypothetical protein
VAHQPEPRFVEQILGERSISVIRSRKANNLGRYVRHPSNALVSPALSRATSTARRLEPSVS